MAPKWFVDSFVETFHTSKSSIPARWYRVRYQKECDELWEWLMPLVCGKNESLLTEWMIWKGKQGIVNRWPWVDPFDQPGTEEARRRYWVTGSYTDQERAEIRKLHPDLGP